MAINALGGNNLFSMFGSSNDTSRQVVTVLLPDKRAGVEWEADALLSSLGFKDADLKAYRQTYGVDLRDKMIDGLRHQPINYNVGQRVYDAESKSYKFQTTIGMDKSLYSQLKSFIVERRAAQPQDVAGASTKVGALNATANARMQQIMAQLPPVQINVVASTAAIPLELPAAHGLPTATEITTAAAKTGVAIAEGALPAAMIASEAATPVLVGSHLAQKYVKGQQAFEMQQADAAYRAAEATSLAQLQQTLSAPMQIADEEAKGKPTVEKARPSAPATPTDEELPKGELAATKGAPPVTTSAPTSRPAQPSTPQPPQHEPPKFDPMKIIPPIIAGTTTTTIGVVADKMLQPNASITAPSMKPDPTREPRGIPEKVKPQDDDVTRTGIARQNEAARVLAKAGYAVEQRPQITDADRVHNSWLKGEKNPDYKIENNIFDCYAPRAGTSARNIASSIEIEKVAKGQTRRIVLNMEDSTVSLDVLREQLQKYPVPNLEEIIIVKDGQVIPFFPAK